MHSPMFTKKSFNMNQPLFIVACIVLIFYVGMEVGKMLRSIIQLLPNECTDGLIVCHQCVLCVFTFIEKVKLFTPFSIQFVKTELLTGNAIVLHACKTMALPVMYVTREF